MDDPLGGTAVAVRVDGAGHGLVGLGVIEQAAGLGDDALGVGAGRSVRSRSTSTGLPRAGASSWMPPESVSTRVHCFSK